MQSVGLITTFVLVICLSGGRCVSKSLRLVVCFGFHLCSHHHSSIMDVGNSKALREFRFWLQIFRFFNRAWCFCLAFSFCFCLAFSFWFGLSQFTAKSVMFRLMLCLSKLSLLLNRFSLYIGNLLDNNFWLSLHLCERLIVSLMFVLMTSGVRVSLS